MNDIESVYQKEGGKMVFISYSSKDYGVANHIREILGENKINCWMAPESIPCGSDYAHEIPTAIESCEYFLLVLSDDSQKSIWVPKELDLAIDSKKIVLPIHIDSSKLESNFRFSLSNVQCMTVSDNLDDVILKIVTRITGKDVASKNKEEKITEIAEQNAETQPLSANTVKKDNSHKFYPIIVIGSLLGAISSFFILEYISAVEWSNVGIVFTTFLILCLSYFSGAFVYPKGEEVDLKQVNYWIGMFPYVFSLILSVIIPHIFAIAVSVAIFLVYILVAMVFVTFIWIIGVRNNE